MGSEGKRGEERDVEGEDKGRVSEVKRKGSEDNGRIREVKRRGVKGREEEEKKGMLRVKTKGEGSRKKGE